MPDAAPKKRLLTLDYLRGYFIAVIIIDHLSRWPSLFSLVTGKALLWITAAEGFVIISGLLVGYVRGFKNKALSMQEVSKKVLLRAGLLYIWSIIGSIVYTAIIWYVPLEGKAPGLPLLPGQWSDLVIQTLTLQYTYVWVHFLTLYALFLAGSPIAIWLMRRGLAWTIPIISVILLVIGWSINNSALQWQALFFIPSVAGFYLEDIGRLWRKLLAKTRRILTLSVMSFTAITILLSIITTFYPALLPGIAEPLNNLFPKETITLWRLGVALIWFIGFALLFEAGSKWIGKYLGWLLLPFGTRSLTAYILHGVAICIISFFTLAGTSLFINTLLGVVCIMIVWALIKIPFVQRVIPQ